MMVTFSVWAMLIWSWAMTISAFVMWKKYWLWRERYQDQHERNIQRLKRDLATPVDRANERQLRLKLAECEEALRTLMLEELDRAITDEDQAMSKEGENNE